LDTIFDSIRLPNMRAGYLFPHTLCVDSDCVHVGGVAQRRVIENVTFDYYLCDMMKRRLARFQSRFPISSRDRWPERENNNNVGGRRIGRWMDC